jgi:hypothetical protein
MDSLMLRNIIHFKKIISYELIHFSDIQENTNFFCQVQPFQVS